MKLKTILLLITILALAGMAQAQFSATLYYLDTDSLGNPAPQITSLCAGGTPLPDGTPVQIFWDNDSNGPDDNDPQPVVGTGDGEVNFNQFSMNGIDATGLPGYFYTATNFQNFGTIPTPARYFLRICSGNLRWESSVIILATGPQERWPHMTCTNTPCAGCQSPPPPEDVQASDNGCDGVQVSWTYPNPVVPPVDRYLVYQGANLIATITDTTVHSYLYAAAPLGEATYSVRARRFCNPDSAFSTFVPDQGTRTPMPPTPTQVTATDANCNSVSIQWQYVTNQGLDHWVIIRGPDSVGFVAGGGTPGQRQFVHTTGLSGVASYCVRGASASCGWGTSACDDGQALQPPAQVTGVSATDGLCNGTTVTWTDVFGETAYYVTRDGNNITGNLPSDKTTYNDSAGTVGTVYLYRVVASNNCGDSPASTGDNGVRVPIPLAPSTLTATSDICLVVILDWSDVATEDSFQVFRNGVRIGSTLANVTTFTDNSASPWIVYQYSILAYQGNCQGTPTAPVQGMAIATPSTPNGVTATDSGCTSITIAWNDVSNETDYVVRRNGAVIGFVPQDTTVYVDTPPPGTYSYRVQAFNDCGASLISAAENGTRFTAPLPPGNFSQLSDDCGVITISWTNPALSHLIFIYRNGVILDSVVSPTSNFIDSVGIAGTYPYYLIASNHCGLSDTSLILNATASQFPSTPQNLNVTDNDCDEVMLEWDASPGTVDKYIIYRDDARYDSVTGLTTSYLDTNVTDGFEYAYAVSALSSACGETEPSASITAELEIHSPPDIPVVVVTIDGEDAHLNWSPISQSTEGCPIIVTGYLVFYSPSSTSPYYYHGFTTDTSYTHTRVVQFAETMFYQVTAYSGPLSSLLQLRPDLTMTKNELETILSR